MGILEDKKVEIEKAFDHIKEGNNHEKCKKMWMASKEFGDAWSLLVTLARTSRDSFENRQNEINMKEEKKIISLFEAQSNEYLKKAQYCLITALQNDMKTTTDDSNSSYDDSFKIEIFQQIFAPSSTNQSMHDDKNEDTLPPMTLEERLEKLNASLPPLLSTHNEPKTREEEMAQRLRSLKNLPTGSEDKSHLPTSYRLEQIHAGMERLGIRVNRNSHENSIQHDGGFESMSDEDQIDFIISAVKDELHFSKNAKISTNINVVTDPTSSALESNEDIDEEIEDDEDRVNSLISAVKDEIELAQNSRISNDTTHHLINTASSNEEKDAKIASHKVESNTKDAIENEIKKDYESSQGESSHSSTNSKGENAVDLIYKAQALLLNAASMLEGDDVDDDLNSLSSDDEDGYDGREDYNQYKSRSVLIRANKSIKKAINSLKSLSNDFGS